MNCYCGSSVLNLIRCAFWMQISLMRVDYVNERTDARDFGCVLLRVAVALFLFARVALNSCYVRFKKA